MTKKLNLVPDGDRFGVNNSGLEGLHPIRKEDLELWTNDGRHHGKLRSTAFNGIEVYYRVVSVPIDMEMNVLSIDDYKKIREFMTEKDRSDFYLQMGNETVSIPAYENLQLLKGMGT